MSLRSDIVSFGFEAIGVIEGSYFKLLCCNVLISISFECASNDCNASVDVQGRFSHGWSPRCKKGKLSCLLGLMLNVPVNSYGHDGTVSSPNHTFFLGASLTKSSCTYFRL